MCSPCWVIAARVFASRDKSTRKAPARSVSGRGAKVNVEATTFLSLRVIFGHCWFQPCVFGSNQIQSTFVWSVKGRRCARGNKSEWFNSYVNFWTKSRRAGKLHFSGPTSFWPFNFVAAHNSDPIIFAEKPCQLNVLHLKGGLEANVEATSSHIRKPFKELHGNLLSY